MDPITEIIPTGKFTKPQLELLRIFSKEMPDKVWEDLNNMISKYFMDLASTEMDRLFDEKGWGSEKIDEWAKEHMRTGYQL